MSESKPKDFAVLFRPETKCYKQEGDEYLKHLLNRNIYAKVIPVMTFMSLNIQQLKISLLSPKKYIGLVFTSQRAVDAVCSAFDMLPPECKQEWKKKEAFSVGEATSTYAKLTLDIDCIGQDSGNGEALGIFIGNVFRNMNLQQPLLFPCSCRRSENMLRVLASKGIGVEEIMCYDSMAHPYLQQNWESSIKVKMPNILVFFSPSAVSYVYDLFRDTGYDIKKFQVFAIGKTTGEALRKFGCNVSGLPSSPCPAELAECIYTNLSLEREVLNSES